VPQRAVVRLVRGGFAELGPEEVLLQLAPASFDAATFEIWGALLSGSRLVIAPPGVLSCEEIGELVERHGVTTLWLTAGLFHQMVDSCVDRLGPVSQLLAGGDVLSVAHVRRALAAGGGRMRLINGYGPTENTTFTCCQPVRGEEDFAGSVPLGRPILGTRVYLLDAEGAPVPIGVSGELCGGGAGLARGYAGRPELTAERFVPSPEGLGEPPGARLYRTGDLARYLPDGRIEFLGRIDRQVKLRGFRIEPGEIESALGSHPSVSAAAVVAVEGTAGQRRLAAFWVAAGEADEEELRAALRERLPEYMVPASFIRLESFPLTPSGKLDRRALLARAAEAESERPAGPTALPRTPVEKLLVEILGAVLQRPDVGVDDNFFELGGDSILALQVVSRARQAGLMLTPRDLFQHQTVAELAAVAQTATADLGDDAEEAGDVPLSPIQRWFFELALAEPHHFNQSVLLALKEEVDLRALRESLRRVVEHHAALRFRFLPDDSAGWRQVVSGVEMPLAEVDLAALPRERRAPALAAAASALQASLNLARGPLARVAAFGLGEDGRRLFLSLHHLVVDGVSWRILLEDLEISCRALAEGSEPRLAPVPTSFRRWSARLTEHARSADIVKELEHWLDPSRTLVRALPRDRPEGENTVESARSIAVKLDPEETRALLEEVSATYHSRINDALLCAMLQTFAAWGREPRLLVDLEGHGREDLFPGADVSRTVGWFTSIFPVLLELDRRAQDPGEHLQSVKEQLRAVPRGGIGYGLLRHLTEGSHAERLRAMPAAEVVFNYLGQLDLGLPPGSLFAPAGEPSGRQQSPRQRRSYLLEVNGMVAAGRLRLVWSYSESLHDRETIQALAEGFLVNLRSLIAHSRSERAPVFTPSDFPEARISQRDLDTLLARVKGRKGRRAEGGVERA
jgi:non-ribosomal peptide synthase protein (TIGR01720 family)